MSVLFSKKLFKAAGWWLVQALDGELVIQFATKEGGKVSEKRVPVAGKNIGRSNETSPKTQAILEAQSRVSKQLDKGYVENEADAALPITDASGNKKPMKAKKVGEVEITDWDTVYMQPKLDGHRCTWQNGQLISGNGKPIDLPHIVEEIHARGLQDLPLDGELYLHGISLQAIGSLVKKPRAESLELSFHIFDLMLPSVQFVERHVALATAMGEQPFQSASGERPGILRLVSTVKVDSEESALAMHRLYMSQAYEGSMRRWGLVGYQDGKRSPYILKGKDMDDDEYEVIGYKEGTPYAEVVDGNVVRTWHVPVWLLKMPGDSKQTFEALCYGTRAEKDAEWTDRDSRVGKMRTIRHFGFTPAGIPDLPVDKGQREDL